MPDDKMDATKLKEAPVPACLMTVFGASGDLTKRLLLPSLYNLAAAKVLPDSFRLLGVAKEDWDEPKFRDHLATTLKQFWGPDADSAVVDWLIQKSSYQSANFDDPASFDAVKTTVERIEKDSQTGGNRLFYLAVAPSFIATMAAQLSRTGLITEKQSPENEATQANKSWRRLVIEKPFGNDLNSAIALNRDLQKSLREDQIYRIDHFAGKDTVQDLAVFRFSNTIFEPLWNRSTIDNIQITAAETVGVEARAGYYEKSGALRDMVPNHMAELLSLVAMEPPSSFDAKHLRDKQVEVLQSVRSHQSQDLSQDISHWALRGQYGAGSINGQAVPGYRQEPGVDPGSNTETYVALKIEIDNWRWSGVPFYIRTGKRCSRALTEIVITFRKPPARLFPLHQQGGLPWNRLFFNLQPDPGIRLGVGVKAPGLTTSAIQDRMILQFTAGPFGNHGKGYERLLHDVMTGNPALFQRADFVEEGWRLVQPLLDAWNPLRNPGRIRPGTVENPQDSFPNYAAGSSGPKAADELLSRFGRAWHSLEEA
jgi:glucose-6-phosphate 1-dehydrogenase